MGVDAQFDAQTWAECQCYTRIAYLLEELADHRPVERMNSCSVAGGSEHSSAAVLFVATLLAI